MTRSYPGFTVRSVQTFLAALCALILLLAPASAQAQVTIAPAVLPGGDVGSAYSTALTASGGTAPYGYAVTAGAMPPGLTLSAGGTISGTPTAGGTFNFTVSATDSAPGVPETGSRAYSLTIGAPTIGLSPASLAPGTTGTAYGVSLVAGGGTAPYTYAVTAGAMPPGTTLSGGGAISGTPTAAGVFNFTVTATDSSTGAGPFTGSRAYSWTINLLAMPIANNVSATVAANSSANSITLNVTGGPPTSVAVTTAPSHGTAIAAGTSITYTPTPGYSGTDSFHYNATNAMGTSAPAMVSITVAPPTVALSAIPATVQAGTPYSASITASLGTAPYSFSLLSGSLPIGVAFSSGGVLSGTPVATGTSNFTVRATDSLGATGTRAYTISVIAPTIALSPAAGPLPGAIASVPYSQTFTASGGAGPYSFSLPAGALPIGMSFSSGGNFSGTPTTAGTYNFSVRATDANGFNTTNNYSLTVTAPTIVLSPAAGALPGATASVPYSQTFTASGGSGPYSFSLPAGALPIGMSFSSGGNFSGTPTTAGTYNFSVRATDANGFNTTNNYSLTVTAPTIVLSPAAGPLPGAITSVPYSQTFTASGGAGPYSFSLISGSIPVGMSLSSTGNFSGTPTMAGTHNFSLRATDANGFNATNNYSLTVTAPTIALSPAAGALPGVTAYSPYVQTFTASGGTGPYNFSLAGGSLPIGVALTSSGTLSGTPTMPGNYGFSVTATDAHGFSVTQAYSVAVTAPVIAVTPGSLPDGATLTAYSQPLAASGGTGPYGFSLDSGALPPGLSLSAAGVISGMPTAPGAFSFTVTATDAHGFTGSTSYTLTIDETAPTAPPQSVTVVGGQSVTIDALAGSTGAPITGVAIGTPPVHGTATVSGTNIVYTANATYAGTDSFTYTLANAGGTSAPATVSVTVNPAPITAPPKAVTILAGQTASVALTEGASGGPFTGATTVSVSPASSGTANITSSGGQFTLSFQPAGSFSGVVTVLYTLTNAYATSAPGTVTITVEARPDPTRDPDVTGLINAQVSAARRFANAQTSNVNRRLERLHDGGGESGFTNSVRMIGPGGRYRPDNLATGGAELDPRNANPGQDPGGAFRGSPAAGADGRSAAPGGGDVPAPVGIWTSGSINWGQRDPNDYSAGYHFTTDGITLGLDYRFSERLVAGAAVGYAHDDSRIGDGATRSRAESYSGTLYASFHPGGGIFFDGLAGYGGLSFLSQRYVVPLNALARGEREGHQWFGSLTAGYDYRNGALHLVPYGRIEVTRSTLAAFTEHGAGPYDLHYALQTADTLTGAASLRGDYRIPARFGFVVPRFRIEYSHDFEGSTRALLSYADWAGGPTYTFEGLTLARDRVLIGGGLDMLVGDQLKLGLDYEGLLKRGGESNRIVLSVALSF